MSRSSGLAAKRAGDYFEDVIAKYCMAQKIEFVKIPTGCKIVYTPRGLKPIFIQTPFDYILFKDGKSVCLDCKTVESGNFTFSMLKSHQVLSLHKISKQNINTGYVVYYRDTGKVIFYNSTQLMNLKPRQSLDQGALLGDVKNIDLKGLFEWK